MDNYEAVQSSKRAVISSLFSVLTVVVADPLICLAYETSSLLQQFYLLKFK